MMRRAITRVLALLAPLALFALPALAEAGREGGTNAGFYSWTYLASVAGATAAVLLIVQYTKGMLDKILHIPTRLLVFVVAFLVLLCAQGFSAGLSWSDLPLLLVNAVVVSTAAYGSYELTFAKVDRSD